MIAGPNGSGKSTIYDELASNFNLGTYVNPDEIQQSLDLNGFLDLKLFNLSRISMAEFDKFQFDHPLINKSHVEGFTLDLTLEGSKIYSNQDEHSYEAALLSDYIRTKLIKEGKRLTFETVMSHPSKIEILQTSQLKGYKNYLYFIGTESPLINIDRVKKRVKQGGHDVDTVRIEDRYYKSMSLLKKAIKNSYRAFIFDNSERKAELILEVFDAVDITYHYKEVPIWIDKYIFSN